MADPELELLRKKLLEEFDITAPKSSNKAKLESMLKKAQTAAASSAAVQVSAGIEEKPQSDTDVQASTDSEEKPQSDVDVQTSTDSEEKPQSDTDVQASTDSEDKPELDAASEQVEIKAKVDFENTRLKIKLKAGQKKKVSKEEAAYLVQTDRTCKYC